MDTVSRTNCKKCRLKKCLAIGMNPEKVGWSNYNVHNCYNSITESDNKIKKLGYLKRVTKVRAQ